MARKPFAQMTISGQTFIPPSIEHKRSEIVAEVNTPEETLLMSVRVENKLNAYVGKLGWSFERNTAIGLLLESYSRNNWTNVCLLPDFSCFAGWEHCRRNDCLQDETHDKTHQLFHCKHGHVRSAVSDFLDSSGNPTALYGRLADWWSSWPGFM